MWAYVWVMPVSWYCPPVCPLSMRTCMDIDVWNFTAAQRASSWAFPLHKKSTEEKKWCCRWINFNKSKNDRFCKYVCVSVNVYVCMSVSCCWRCVTESFITCGVRDVYTRKKLSILFWQACWTFFTKETRAYKIWIVPRAVNSGKKFFSSVLLIECFF